MEEEATEAIEIEHHEMHAFAGVEPTILRSSIAPSHGSFLSNFSGTSCVISYSRFAKTLLYVLLTVTCVPLIVGGAFTSIFIEDGNYNGAVVSFLIACLSLGILSMFVMHLLKKLEKYHDSKTLEGLKLFGMLMSVASGISLGVYTILAFINKQSFNLHGLNYFSSAAFSGLCLITSIELFIVAQWYQNALRASEMAGVSLNSFTLQSTPAVIN